MVSEDDISTAKGETQHGYILVSRKSPQRQRGIGET